MTEATERFLVLHDYGMGGLWWWVRATSADEIVRTIAEVEVVTDDDSIRRATQDTPDEFDLDALTDETLIGLRDQRTAQRDQPGFGVLTGRDRVHLRDGDPSYEGTVFLEEYGPDGRLVRRVIQEPDGTATRGDDFPINSPIDLHDPRYVPRELTADEFERAWEAALPESDEDRT